MALVPLAAAALMSFAIHGNRVEMKLDQGAAELTWVTPSTFRFRHSVNGPLAPLTLPEREAVDVKASETPAALTLTSKCVRVSIARSDLQVEVQRLDGSPLMADATPAHPVRGGVAWERVAGAAVRFYGLGPRTDLSFDLRGKAMDAVTPMLVTTAGYGEFHASPGAHRFDIAKTRPGRYRIEAPAVDYYFFYGPSPKEVLEEAKVLRPGVRPTPVIDVRAGSWETLRDAVQRLVHASFSGILMPVFDMRPYAGVPAPLAERVRQFGQICPGLAPEQAALTPFRRQLTTFLATYGEEARDRGYPYFHPLPFQFPEDIEAINHADEFMLGDEMLVAPITSPSGSRQVYLPRGIWTGFESNQVYRGRNVITITDQSLPVFARNGTIVPLDPVRDGEPMLLHYFPSLGAEFFLLETSIGDWSQAHAAPAADIMRLEIESKVERPYEWVVRNVPRPLRVEFEKRFAEVKSRTELKPDTWFYDTAMKNLHVRVHVAAGEDSIVNLIPPE